MPITPTYPGVYIEEIPSGVRTITGVSTSVTAFIGAAKRGSINKAVRILSYSDYEREFGGLDADSEISYALRQFFLNGGSDAWVVRLAKDTSFATATLTDASSRPSLKITAVDAGKAGNNIEVRVDYQTSNPASSFNLAINYISPDNPQDNSSEKFDSLSLNSKDPRYVLDIVNGIVSKYIGETEKNLRRVFDAAETGGAILLFDEADALFGKRSEVKDSHDRYANIEVSYLLQRMEAYRGLAILTTNLKSALDTAFLRRIRFIVQFPFPDAAQRQEIWRRIFPPKTPTAELDLDKLARLNIPGGNIRNIALNAAFLAADAGESVQMSHLLRAAKCEYGKLEKSLTEAEIGGWL